MDLHASGADATAPDATAGAATDATAGAATDATAGAATDATAGPAEPKAKLVSARGAAEMLGVTDGAVRKLIARGTFPAPDVLLDARRLWCRTTIEAYAGAGRRRPGRPRKDRTELREPESGQQQAS
ncbi:hypothetical protein GCM10009759_77610 [Kitasatospora saccharophila]|uniref:AlpA family transcriptional regulator n=1 Tax=Kitasatospora saccharophila TaxID=407973 RepID=A0ABP5K0R9_9ACTN